MSGISQLSGVEKYPKVTTVYVYPLGNLDLKPLQTVFFKFPDQRSRYVIWFRPVSYGLIVVDFAGKL